MAKKDRVLVTGAAGYIGSVLTEELLRGGYSVTALDSFLFDQTSLLHLMSDSGLTLVRGDARDEKLMRKLLRDVEFVIPLAAIVGAPACDRDRFAASSTNLDAIANLINWTSSHQKVIYPNTNSGYGLGQGAAFCDENTPIHPISHYGKTKCMAEEVVLADGGVAFRLATVFGVSPRMRLDLLVNDFVFRAMRDKAIVLFEADFKRNYIHVFDVARAFMFAMEHFDTMSGEAFNLGLSDANLSKRELCERIQEHIPEFRFVEDAIGKDPDKRNYIVSNAKIESAGFMPAISLDFGIEELMRAYPMLSRGRFANV